MTISFTNEGFIIVELMFSISNLEKLFLVEGQFCLTNKSLHYFILEKEKNQNK